MMEFTKLTIEDREIISNFLEKYPPLISEMTFTNLFSWRETYGYKYAICADHLIIKSDKGKLKNLKHASFMKVR